MNLHLKTNGRSRIQAFETHLLKLRVAGFNPLTLLLQLILINPVKRFHIFATGGDHSYSRFKQDFRIPDLRKFVVLMTARS